MLFRWSVGRLFSNRQWAQTSTSDQLLFAKYINLPPGISQSADEEKLIHPRCHRHCSHCSRWFELAGEMSRVLCLIAALLIEVMGQYPRTYSGTSSPLPSLESPWPTDHLVCPNRGDSRGVHCDRKDTTKFYLSCTVKDGRGGTVTFNPQRSVEGQCPQGYVCFVHGTQDQVARGKWNPGLGKPLSRIDCISPGEKRRRMEKRRLERIRLRTTGNTGTAATSSGTESGRKRPREGDAAADVAGTSGSADTVTPPSLEDDSNGSSADFFRQLENMVADFDNYVETLTGAE